MTPRDALTLKELVLAALWTLVAGAFLCIALIPLGLCWLVARAVFG